MYNDYDDYDEVIRKTIYNFTYTTPKKLIPTTTGRKRRVCLFSQEGPTNAANVAKQGFYDKYTKNESFVWSEASHLGKGDCIVVILKNLTFNGSLTRSTIMDLIRCKELGVNILFGYKSSNGYGIYDCSIDSGYIKGIAGTSDNITKTSTIKATVDNTKSVLLKSNQSKAQDSKIEKSEYDLRLLLLI
jgi:hypothetical protein